MTTQFFLIDDGTLELHHGKMVILDDAKMKKTIAKLGAVFPLFISLLVQRGVS